MGLEGPLITEDSLTQSKSFNTDSSLNSSDHWYNWSQRMMTVFYSMKIDGSPFWMLTVAPLHDYVPVIIYRVEHVWNWTGDATIVSQMPLDWKLRRRRLEGEHEKLQIKRNRGVFMVCLVWPKSFFINMFSMRKSFLVVLDYHEEEITSLNYAEVILLTTILTFNFILIAPSSMYLLFLIFTTQNFIKTLWFANIIISIAFVLMSIYLPKLISHSPT